MDGLNNNTGAKDSHLEFWEQVNLWEKAENYLGYGVVPFVSKNRGYGVQIFWPSGWNLTRIWDMRSAEEAIAAGKKTVDRDLDRFQKESVLDQLVEEGLITDSEMRHVLKSL